MGRPSTGSVFRSQGKVYARITWTDRHGKRHDRKRLAMDETHALTLARDMLDELRRRKYIRIQPTRSKRYLRNDLKVYFVQILDSASCPIKIGTSNDIPKRIKMLLTHLPYEVRLLGSWSGNVWDEKAIHSRFADCRIAREWFRPTPELLAYIAEKTQVAA